LRRLVLLALSLVSSAAACDARAEERVRVALLPILVHSAEGREYLQQGLADMLVARLARSERLAVLPIEDAKTATTDAAEARKVGAANDAAYVLFGSFTRFGEGASLDLQCVSVTDDERAPRHIYVHAPSMAELVSLLDGAADRATYAVLGAPPEGTAVSAPPRPAPEPRAAELPRDVSDTDGALGNRDVRRAPGLPTDRDETGVR
jgi:TolB-like protein